MLHYLANCAWWPLVPFISHLSLNFYHLTLKMRLVGQPCHSMLLQQGFVLVGVTLTLSKNVSGKLPTYPFPKPTFCPK